MKSLKNNFFERDAEVVAKELLGKKIRFKNCSGIIVETEAYKDDPASHAHRKTPRSLPIIENHGTVYVYLNYGMYYLVNFTCDKTKAGAVLIRAVEPVDGIESMKKRRKKQNISDLCNGPGKICQAFGITMKQHNKNVGEEIEITDSGKKVEFNKSSRVGISKGLGYKWRYYIKNNKFVSKG